MGGTGLYFNALLKGLSPVPPIKIAIREKWRSAGQTWTGQELFSELERCDPIMAKELRASDIQRVVRALEVIESTGKSLSEWQAETGRSVLEDASSVRKLLLMPDRTVLHRRINERFDKMLVNGAVEEVEALVKRDLSASLPVMKAIGVPQIKKYLLGDLTLSEASEQSKAASRQYAKRQSTWFNNSFEEGWHVIAQP